MKLKYVVKVNMDEKMYYLQEITRLSSELRGAIENYNNADIEVSGDMESEEG